MVNKNSQINIRQLLITLIMIASPMLIKAELRKVNHILVLDKTLSMVGKGDGNNINTWISVKPAIENYIREIPFGDKVTIYTFHTDLSRPVTFDISSSGDIQTAINFIENIEINGLNTAIYSALKEVFETLPANKGYSNQIFLFTDGHDNTSPYTIEQIEKIFNAKRGDFDYCWYVTFGKQIPDEIKSWEARDSHLITSEQPRKPAPNFIGEIQKPVITDTSSPGSLNITTENTDNQKWLWWFIPVLITVLLLTAVIIYYLFYLPGKYPIFRSGELQLLLDESKPNEFQKILLPGLHRIVLGKVNGTKAMRQNKISGRKCKHILPDLPFLIEIVANKEKGKVFGVLRYLHGVNLYESTPQGRMYNYNESSGDGVYKIKPESGSEITLTYFDVKNARVIEYIPGNNTLNL